MHIDEASFPVAEGWSGDLQQPKETFTIRGGGLPRVSLGKPDWWSDETILGDKWQAPAGGKRYGLVRFKFSLRPEAPQTIKQAYFMVRLSAQGGGENPLAFDLYPRELKTERKDSVKLSIGPDLTFGEVGGSLGSVVENSRRGATSREG